MYKIVLALTIFLLVPTLDSIATDQTIDVIPGSYDITTKTTSNFNPNGQIDNDIDCMKNNQVGVKDFMPDEEACTASNIKKSGNKLTFDMKCEGSQAMPAMTGKAEISADGKNISSKYKMVGSYQGQEFSINSESTGKNTGPCK